MVRVRALPAEQRCSPAGYLTLSCSLQDKQEALPFLTKPHDALRLGVRSLKEDASVSHSVEAIQANVRTFPSRKTCLAALTSHALARYDLQTCISS